MGNTPNTIACDSKQFATGVFMYGIPASIILMVVAALATALLWGIIAMHFTFPR
jgi:hypothetical protein